MTRAKLFGVHVDLLTLEQTVARCADLVESRQPIQHVVINAGKVVLMQRNAALTSVVRDCDLVSADGQSIVWAGRLLGAQVPERVAGIDLMERLLAEAEARRWPVYFLGARPEVLERFVEVVRERFPRIEIAGARDGYFADDAEVADEIGGSGARLLFVGMSSPRKESFLAAQLPRMGGVFAMGVGGSFDVWAGKTKRAPLWMQRRGLEWFYRFAQEPRRMWRRYLVGNARFVGLVVRELLAARAGGE